MGKKSYEAPAVRVVGSLHELTLIVAKNTTNTPDGFSFNGTVLTS
jgi:hypothetical protein